MQLKEIVHTQHSFDEEHGWSAIPGDFQSILASLNSDIIGIVGEIGEFANIVKKINLIASRDLADGKVRFESNREVLAEELSDVFIYLIRLAAHLGVDLEKEYLKKLEINKSRYLSYQRGRSSSEE